MKKNVIALAVAAALAAPMAAQADAKISGQVKVTVADSSSSKMNAGLDNSFTFTASEDIGGGMKALAKLTMDADNGGGMKDQYAGLTGGFGTVIAGNMESLTEGKISSMMDDGMSTHNAGSQLESRITSFGRVAAAAYVSPNFNGLTVGAAVVLQDLDGNDDSIDGTDIAVMYNAGPLSVSASMFDVDGTQTVTTVAGAYSMGALKVSAMMAATDAQGDATDYMVRADYKVGNNSFLLGHKASGSAYGGGDVSTLKATHSFSKTAAAYVGFRSKENFDDVMFFGMIKKF